MSVQVLNMFLFSLGMRANFCFLHVPCSVAGNYYCFKNEGYLLKVFKMRFFPTKLCLYLHSALFFLCRPLCGGGGRQTCFQED